MSFNFQAQTMSVIEPGSLAVSYVDQGRADGLPVVLLHGFPYGIHAYDTVAALLSSNGCRCIIPYLRGYGPTRFLFADTMRSGQQAALGCDLLALLDALELPPVVLAGYDWGGRAACVATALRPNRVRGLVTAQGYNIQDIAAASQPKAPIEEHRLWYYYYFHTERGRRGLDADIRGFCRLLWQLWSPTWKFNEATFSETATAFDNPDFTAIVVHSYRHRFGLAPGDPFLDPIETRLALQPDISVPTIALHGSDDGIACGVSGVAHFTGSFEKRILPGIGHNVPQEATMASAQAVLDLIAQTAGKADCHEEMSFAKPIPK